MEFKKWLKTRPAVIQELAGKYPPGEYIIKDGAPYGVSCPGTKVHLNSYYENGLVSVIVMAYDKLPQAIHHEILLCSKHGKNAKEIHKQNIKVDIDPIWMKPLKQ